MTTFIQKEKRQKILIYIFIMSVLIIFIILWYGFSQKNFSSPQKEFSTPLITYPNIKINWQMFEDSNSTFRKLEKKLQPFEKIKEFEDNSGKENPFSY